MYSGDLHDVLEIFEIGYVRRTPTYWWPADRAWCVCTDNDLTFTLIGGSASLIGALLADDVLECIQVEASSRVGYLADHLNR